MGARALALAPGPPGAPGSRPNWLRKATKGSRRAGFTAGGSSGAKKGMKAGHKPGSVLLPLAGAAAGDGHLSGTAVTGGLERRTVSGTGAMANRCPWALLPAGVYRASTSRCCWCALTAPLHPCLCHGQARAIGGVFLWHSPHGHPHWALPSKPGHWGARTFLNQARARPEGQATLIATTSPAFTVHHACVASTDNGNCGAVAQPDRATVS